jgi:hypothetical protein
MEQIKFNINNEVKVKITDIGYDIWLAYENKFTQYLPTYPITTIEELKAKADKDGYTEFQMWDMMSIFGSHMKMGFENPIETNIIINTTIT